MPVPMADETQSGDFAGRGQPLPTSTRVFLEQRLDRDLSFVRVHNDQDARHLTRDLGATALTVGHDIYLGDRSNADSPSGRRLLAHEVVHALQNARSPLPTEPAGEFAVAEAAEPAIRRQASGEPVVREGGGGYKYQQFPDGTIVILAAPRGKGVGTRLPPGNPVNAEITREIGPYPGSAAATPMPSFMTRALHRVAEGATKLWGSAKGLISGVVTKAGSVLEAAGRGITPPGSGEAVVKTGGGGYTYRQYPDGGIVIEAAPGRKGVGSYIGPGTAANSEITTEIGPYPSPEGGMSDVKEKVGGSISRVTAVTRDLSDREEGGSMPPDSYISIDGGVVTSGSITRVLVDLEGYFRQRGVRVRVTSAVRTPEKQLGIIVRKAKHYGLDRKYPSVLSATVEDVESWRSCWDELLNVKGFIVNPPVRARSELPPRWIGVSPHVPPNRAFDLAGADLETIRTVAEKYSADHPGAIRQILQEPKNGCVHIGLGFVVEGESEGT